MQIEKTRITNTILQIRYLILFLLVSLFHSAVKTLLSLLCILRLKYSIVKEIIIKNENKKGKLICTVGNKIFFKIAQIANTKNASRLESANVGLCPLLEPV